MSNPGFQGIESWLPDGDAHRRRIADKVNQLNEGKFNATLDITLRASHTTTVVNDARIGYYSFLDWMPMSASAASAKASMYVAQSDMNSTSLTIHHASNAATDQTFRLLIIG